MLLSNPFKPDPRVYEEAKALVEDGHHVTILAWDRELRFSEREKIGKIEIIRVKVKGSYGKFSGFFFPLLLYYKKAKEFAGRIDYQAVHAHDFDTLPLGICLARRRKVPLIYDVHDDYASMIAESVPSFLASFVDLLQRALMRFATHIIYANEALHRLFGIPGHVVMNCKDPEDYEISVEELRTSLKLEGFTIVYIGIFRQGEFLRLLIEAAKRSGAYLILGGDGPYREEVLRLISGEERIKYVGWVPADEIPKYTKLADAIVVLNDPSKRYDRVSTPVKMFEAMAAGIPVIVARGTEAEKIVSEENCGLAIDFGNLNSLILALQKLQDKQLWKKLSENAIKAAMKKYNRRVQMARLKKLYRELNAQ